MWHDRFRPKHTEHGNRVPTAPANSALRYPEGHSCLNPSRAVGSAVSERHRHRWHSQVDDQTKGLGTANPEVLPSIRSSHSADVLGVKQSY